MAFRWKIFASFAFQQLTSKHKNTILDKLLQKKDYVGSPFFYENKFIDRVE